MRALALVAFILIGFGGFHVAGPGLYCKHWTHHHTFRACISVPVQTHP